MQLAGSGNVIATIQQPGEALSMTLSVNQKITATILSLVDGRAVLSVRGVKVNAQLSSPEQMASLQNMRQAQFLVKDVSNRAVELQLLPSKASAQQELLSDALPASRLTELSRALLTKMGLPLDKTNMMLTGTLLERGMDVTPEILRDLQQALSNLVKWGPKEMQTAVQMKMAGLPLSSGTVNLLNNTSPELSGELINLKEQIQQLLSASTMSNNQAPLPAQTRQLANNVLSQLDSLILQWSNSPQNLQQGIQKAIELVSRSLEKDLAEFVVKGQPQDILNNSESLMLSLSLLRSNLGQHGTNELTKSIDEFMGHLRSLQFVNSPSETESSQGQWLQVDVPLRFITENSQNQSTNPQAVQNYNQTHLKIAYRQGGKDTGREVDPNYTRLVIQVEINPGETLDVDLSIVNQKIGALFTASSELIKDMAEEELPGLQSGLESAGFQLETSRFVVEKTKTEIDDGLENQGLVAAELNNRFDLEI